MLDPDCYAIYVGTFALFRAAMRSGNARQLQALIDDVSQRSGPQGIASLLAMSDATNDRPRRAMLHFARAVEIDDSPAEEP